VRSAASVVCALALATLTMSPVQAQILEGYLLEGGSGSPIAGGRVGLFTPRGFTIDVGVSDDSGFFQMAAPETGVYFLTADADGFVDLTHGDFELAEGESTSFDVYLRPQPVELEGVEVEVERVPLALRVRELRLAMMGFRERERSGLGHFISPERLEQRNPHQASDMLRMIPRIQIGQGFGSRIEMDCGEFVAFIDNIAVWSGQGWDMDNFVYIDDVSAIEVYTSLAQIPVEFRQRQNCGAVVVWTKG
jgi:hypothetical protein